VSLPPPPQVVRVNPLKHDLTVAPAFPVMLLLTQESPGALHRAMYPPSGGYLKLVAPKLNAISAFFNTQLANMACLRMWAGMSNAWPRSTPFFENLTVPATNTSFITWSYAMANDKSHFVYHVILCNGQSEIKIRLSRDATQWPIRKQISSITWSYAMANQKSDFIYHVIGVARGGLRGHDPLKNF